MKYQDIHLEDKSLLESFRQAWGVGDYAGAFAILQQTQLADKQLIADTLNYILRQTEALEKQSDPTFKKDKIQATITPPTGLTSGDLWFKKED